MNMVSKNSKGELVVDLHMNITAKDAFLYILGGLVTIISFFLVDFFGDFSVMKDDIKELPEKYVLKEDYKSELTELKGSIKSDVSELKGSLQIIQKDIKQLLKEQN